MNNVREYKLVTESEDEKKFVEEINNLIAEGWQPLGGVCVTKSTSQKLNEENLPAAGYDMQNKLFLVQAMAR